MNNIELIDLYKAEKEIITGNSPLEPFEPFREWKMKYLKDYAETHRTVSIQEADTEAEEDIKQASKSIFNLNKETTMTDNTKPEVLKPAATVTKTTKTDKPATVTSVKKEPSKASVAQGIFDSMYADVVAGTAARKDVIARFESDANLTKNGASTYYQKMKKAADSAS